MKVAIYCRVSTQDQCLEQQKEACSSYCNNQGWEYEVFEEKISGAKSSRPLLDVMMQRVRTGEFGAVVVWKLDRLGRSLLHLVQLVEEFKNKNVRFISVTQGVDTDSPTGKLMYSILSSIAEFERELIKERTKARVSKLKAQGKHLGRPSGSKDKGKRRRAGYIKRWLVEQGKEVTPQEYANMVMAETGK